MTADPTPTIASLAELTERARALAGRPERTILGIVGAPGAGKSTLAEQLAEALGPELAVVVPMDGFHYDQRVLERLGRAERKGAPDTFDAAGMVALLRRLRDQSPNEVVFAPRFDRDLEQSIGSAIEVWAQVPLVIIEGNYLLADGPWAPVAGLFDQSWFLATDERLRVDRLVARHIRHGRSPQAAREWTLGPDQANAELIASHAERADLVLRLTD